MWRILTYAVLPIAAPVWAEPPLLRIGCSTMPGHLQSAIDPSKQPGVTPAPIQIAPEYVDTSFVGTRIEAAP